MTITPVKTLMFQPLRHNRKPSNTATCMEFYSEQNIQSSVHRLHSKAYLVMFKIIDLYIIKLMNSQFRNALLLDAFSI